MQCQAYDRRDGTMAIEFKRKCCATCAYWGGLRKANAFKNAAMCDKPNNKGICGGRKNSNKGHSTEAGYKCAQEYEKWQLLSKMR